MPRPVGFALTAWEGRGPQSAAPTRPYVAVPGAMADSLQEWANKVAGGDRRAIARAISALEMGDAAGRELLKKLFPKTGRAYVIGITGSPGTGKSTLVEKLAGEYRKGGAQVGILAVDPTSPFSGGAILGDRIRMQNLSTDDGVYIRSMATRGMMGGLAPAAHDVVSVLDAAGCQIVLVETVGVGQDEVEVARLADATVLVLVPGMGDDIQTFKAGVMEIADIFVVNKADRPGADRVEYEITTMLSVTPRASDWQPPIVKTVATSGEGVVALRAKMDEFRAFVENGPLRLKRQRERWRLRLLALFRQTLFERTLSERREITEARVEDLAAHRVDPYTAVEELMGESGITAREVAISKLMGRPGQAPALQAIKIHHVGIAVSSLGVATPVFEKLLGRQPEPEEVVDDQKVRVAAFSLGESRIELLEATAPESPIARFIAKRGPGLHHLTLEVPDLAGALEELERSGVRLIDKEPRTGAAQERIAFLHPSSTAGVLIELIEARGSQTK